MTTTISTLGQALSQISRFNQQQSLLSDLQTQLATGKKTQNFSGLGTDVILSLRSRSDIRAIDTYMSNISVADSRIENMLNAIEEFQSQARNMASLMSGQQQEGEIDMEVIHDMATNMIPFMEDLINSQDGERYLFGGAVTDTPPLNMVNSGTYQLSIQEQLLDWRGTASIPGSQTASATDVRNFYQSASDSLIGYNSYLSSNTAGNVTVRADKKSEVDYTTFGNHEAFRDIMVALSTVKELTNTDSSAAPGYYIEKINLEPSDYIGATGLGDLPATPPPSETSTMFTSGLLSIPVVEEDFEDPAVGQLLEQENSQRSQSFFEMFNNLTQSLYDRIDDLDNVRFSLETDRVRLQNMREQHEFDKTNLQETVSNVEDADMSEVAVKINSLQIQLQASYQVTATVSGLNLANFLN